MTQLARKRVLLVISGGIAAHKTLDLIRRLRERGAAVRCVLTKGGAEFVTPLSLAALSEEKVFTDLFSLTDEAEMGHIRLSREADLVVIAPASADLLAKMAAGRADDLATTLLLATDKRILAAPAMNVRMWEHPATQENLKSLHTHGLFTIGPNEGDMACGEYGMGRMAEPDEILAAIERFFATGARLSGRRALVTSGPTYEAIDPVRYIATGPRDARATPLPRHSRAWGPRPRWSPARPSSPIPPAPMWCISSPRGNACGLSGGPAG